MCHAVCHALGYLTTGLAQGCQGSVFFSRENQNPFRENFGQFLGFHPWKNFSFRENFAKTARENTRCVRENFFQITYVKMKKCGREK